MLWSTYTYLTTTSC